MLYYHELHRPGKCENIINLIRELKGRLRQPPDFAKRKVAGAMVTYGDLFSFVIMLCAVVLLLFTRYTKSSALVLAG